MIRHIYLLSLSLILIRPAFAQDTATLQADVDQLKQVVAGQQAEIVSKRTKVWRKELANKEYMFGAGNGLIPELKATFIQAGKWYRVTIECTVFGTAELSVVDGVGSQTSSSGTKLIASANTSEMQYRDRYISASTIYQAKTNEFNAYVWTSNIGDDFDGYISFNPKPITLTIEELDITSQPW